MIASVFLGRLEAGPVILKITDIGVQIDAIAMHTIAVLLTVKGSSRKGGLGEKIVKADILGKYIPRLMNLKKKTDTSLTDREAEDLAYAELFDALDRAADYAGNNNGITDSIERSWITATTNEKVGLQILFRIQDERKGLSNTHSVPLGTHTPNTDAY